MPVQIRAFLERLLIVLLVLLPVSGVSASQEQELPAGKPPLRVGEGVTRPGYSPVFRSFLEKNPDFAGHLAAKRYTEATALLDRWATERPADPEIDLARVYLLLEQGRLDAAWERARVYRGPEPYEVLHRVGHFALDRARRDTLLNTEARAKVVELGLQAAALAMEVRDDAFEAPALGGMLLVEKAKLTSDAAEQRALLDEARRLQGLALELQRAGRAERAAPLSPSPPRPMENRP